MSDIVIYTVLGLLPVAATAVIIWAYRETYHKK